MRKLTPAFFVGLFIIAGAVASVYMFGAVEKRATTEANSYVVTAMFDDVSGLAEGSHITMSGIPVGDIDRIELDPETRRRARVSLRIDHRIELHVGAPDDKGVLRNGAVLRRRQASLLGDYYLELTRGVSGPIIKDGGEILIVVSSTGLEAVLGEVENSGDLFGRLDRIARNIETITASLATTVGGDAGTKRLDKVLDDVAIATGNIAEATDEMKLFMRDVVTSRQTTFGRIIDHVDQFAGDAASISGRIDQSIGRSLANIEALTGDMRSIAASSGEKIDAIAGKVDAGVVRLQTSMATLEEALANVRDISGKINEGQGTLGRLVNDDHLADSLEETVDDVDSIVKSFSRLQTRVELRVEYSFLGEEPKTYIALRLQPKSDRYYQIELIDDPRGTTVFSTQVTETNDPSLPAVLRESTTRTVDELKFSFFFAKRFHFLVGRFGLVESSGGGGIDFLFLDDALRLAFDVFDFGMDRAPRVKATVSVRLWDHLLVMGGVDDIFDDGQRDYFGGLGITFTDDDLKALLTVAPIPSM